MWKRSAMYVTAALLTVMGVVFAAPAAHATNPVACAGRWDFASVTANGTRHCYANAGSYPISLYGVTEVCSGNNNLAVYVPSQDWIRLNKWECVYPGGVYVGPTIYLS